MNTRPSSNQPSLAQAASQLAHLLKAAADPLRLEVLRVLATDSYGVLELCHLFEVKQSSMSHHLKVLATAGLVNTRREGNSVFYRRGHAAQIPMHQNLQQALHRAVNQLQPDTALQQRIDDVHQQRARTSRDFFAEHAATLREKQDLIAALDVYASQVVDLLDASPLPGNRRVLEVGPGEGAFLMHLSQRFDEVTALDNTEAMLSSAKAFAQTHALSNITFIHDDTSYCRNSGDIYDCIVINMVLHHTPSPAQMFADVTQALALGGALLVCDLCDHNQDWVRNACGDLWLGFDPADLSRWAGENSFREGQSIYFALRNGFQIQIRQFIKE